jgi:hypothetical protein
MFQPSHQWTEEERRIVVSAIGITMMNEAQGKKYIASARSHELGNRLRILATAGPEFLEANRALILDGLEPILNQVSLDP